MMTFRQLTAMFAASALVITQTNCSPPANNDSSSFDGGSSSSTPPAVILPPYQSDCNAARAAATERYAKRQPVTFTGFTPLVEESDRAAQAALADMCEVGAAEIRNRCLTQGGPLVGTPERPSISYAVEVAPSLVGVCATAQDFYKNDDAVFSSFYRAYVVTRNHYLEGRGDNFVSADLSADERTAMVNFYANSYSVANADDFPADVKATRCVAGHFAGMRPDWVRSWRAICSQALETYPNAGALNFSYGHATLVRYMQTGDLDLLYAADTALHKAAEQQFELPAGLISAVHNEIEQFTTPAATAATPATAAAAARAAPQSTSQQRAASSNNDDWVVPALVVGGFLVGICALAGCFSGNSNNRPSANNNRSGSNNNYYEPPRRDTGPDPYEAAARNRPYTPPAPPPREEPRTGGHYGNCPLPGAGYGC